MIYRSQGTWFTPVVASDPAGPQVDSSKQRVVVDDAPDVILDLFESDLLAFECIAQEVLTREKPERSCRADSADFQMASVFRAPQTARVRFRRRLPSLYREVPVERIVGALVIVPLSVRIASGRPYSGNSRLKAGLTPSVRTEGNPERSSIRL